MARVNARWRRGSTFARSATSRWRRRAWSRGSWFWSVEGVGDSLVGGVDVFRGLADEHRLEDSGGVDGVDFGGDFELVADGDLESLLQRKSAVPVEGEFVVETWWQGFAADGFVHAMMVPRVQRQSWVYSPAGTVTNFPSLGAVIVLASRIFLMCHRPEAPSGMDSARAAARMVSRSVTRMAVCRFEIRTHHDALRRRIAWRLTKGQCRSGGRRDRATQASLFQ